MVRAFRRGHIGRLEEVVIVVSEAQAFHHCAAHLVKFLEEGEERGRAVAEGEHKEGDPSAIKSILDRLRPGLFAEVFAEFLNNLMKIIVDVGSEVVVL